MGHGSGARLRPVGRERLRTAGSRPPRLSLCLLAAIAVSAGLAASPRLEAPSIDRRGVLLLESRISLPRVTPAELLPAGRNAVSLGRWSGRAADFDGDGVRTRIVRRLPTVWRMRLAEGQEPHRLDVQYEISSLDGRPDRLVSADGGASEVRVELRPIPPLVVPDAGEGTVVEGGLVLYVDLESVRSAGRYTGTLTVTLNQL
jgi:hypothetical protein